MAAPATSFGTYTAKGIREDLSDMIYNLTPDDTPIFSSFGKASVHNTLFEWQTDTLDTAVTTNAQIEGDDVTQYPVQNPTVRVGNYTQISRKVVATSGTLEATDRAGRRSEMAYQMSKKSGELKMDIEATICANQGGDAGSVTTPRKTATFGAWFKTNVDMAVDGVNPTYTAGVPATPRTDGTQRAFTEVNLANAVQLGWTNGAKPGKWTLYVGPVNKHKVSAFAGIATKTFQMNKVAPGAIIGSADVYVSEFGTFTVEATRHQRERDAWLLDSSFWKVAYLRPFFSKQLAVTGDNEKRLLLVEWGLKSLNEAASAAILDLTTT